MRAGALGGGKRLDRMSICEEYLHLRIPASEKKKQTTHKFPHINEDVHCQRHSVQPKISTYRCRKDKTTHTGAQNMMVMMMTMIMTITKYKKSKSYIPAQGIG